MRQSVISLEFTPNTFLEAPRLYQAHSIAIPTPYQLYVLYGAGPVVGQRAAPAGCGGRRKGVEGTVPGGGGAVFYLAMSRGFRIFARRKDMAKKQKYYVVWQGKQPGIYTDREACREQVQSVQGAQYKAFDTQTEAEQAIKLPYSSVVKPTTERGGGPAATKGPQGVPGGGTKTG